MITDAIMKITNEVNKISSDHAQKIGEYLIDHMTEEAAALIIQDIKTLEGCISAIIKNAKAKASGRVAIIEDTEVYSWAREYYGFGNMIGHKPATSVPDGQMNVDLADLL